MKLILATTPFLAKFAFSVPAFAPQNMEQLEELMLEELAQLDGSPSIDCPDVWNRTCSGTNSNGDGIYGSWTCGARVQYVHDYKLGRSPSLSAAIDQVLSECPTQCQELANNQCDDHAQENLKVPDCSATWDNVCSGINSVGQRIYRSFTCGARVLYVHNQRPAYQNLERSVDSVYYQCRDKCENINNAQCVDFVEEKLNQVTVASVQATTRPLGTCQEVFDRYCTDRWGTFTCGARVKYDNTEKQMNLIDAISNTNRQCGAQCREFQNGNCDTFISENVDEIVVPSLNEVSDDYETVASVQATTRPLGTCQEAYDRTCTEGWGSFTCGARVKYDHTEKRLNLNDAISNTNRQCPTECREFQNGSCDTFISAAIDEIVVENGSGSN
jgi:hypothetical protein